MLLSFGKFKGQDIREIPIEYLRWVFDNVFTLKDWELLAILNEFERRGEPLSQPEKRSVPIKHDFVQDIYRTMSKKYHPDKGGSNEAMQAINDFYQQLKQGLK